MRLHQHYYVFACNEERNRKKEYSCADCLAGQYIMCALISEIKYSHVIFVEGSENLRWPNWAEKCPTCLEPLEFDKTLLDTLVRIGGRSALEHHFSPHIILKHELKHGA